MVRAAAWICSCEIAVCELEGSDFAVGEIELINVLNDLMWRYPGAFRYWKV